jgi:hypothetical protein
LLGGVLGHAFDDLSLFLGVEQAGHLTRIEQVINILKERVIPSLPIPKQEASTPPPATIPHKFLDILPKLSRGIPLAHLNSEHDKLTQKASQSRNRLPARSPDPHQKAMPLRLAQHPEHCQEVV